MASKYSLILTSDQINISQTKIEKLKSSVTDKSNSKFWKISLGFLFKLLLMAVSLIVWFSLLAISNKSGYGVIEYAITIAGFFVWLMVLTYFIKKINKISYINECFFTMWEQPKDGSIVKIIEGFIGEEQLKDTIGDNESFWRKFQNDGHVVTPTGAINGIFKLIVFLGSLSLFFLLFLSVMDLGSILMPLIKDFF